MSIHANLHEGVVANYLFCSAIRGVVRVARQPTERAPYASRELAQVDLRDNKITDSERRTALRLIVRRVAEGGVRLAAVLNRVYGG